MKDKRKKTLEQFMKDEKGAFDTELPPSTVWDTLNKQLEHVDEEKRSVRLASLSSRYQGWWKAAAVFFFATSVYLFFQTSVDSRPEISSANVPVVAHEGFSEVEMYYTGLITETQEQIDRHAAQGDAMGVEFKEDLKKMEAMYLVLKEEMNQNASEKVVEAVILNMILRIDMLNEQLKMLQKKQKETLNEEDSTQNS